LPDFEKDVITGNIQVSGYYQRRYTSIVPDNFGSIFRQGVSIVGTKLYISTPSRSNPGIKLYRIYGFKQEWPVDIKDIKILVHFTLTMSSDTVPQGVLGWGQ